MASEIQVFQGWETKRVYGAISASKVRLLLRRFVENSISVCLTGAGILSARVILLDDNIFNSGQDVTGSVRLQVMLYRTYH